MHVWCLVRCAVVTLQMDPSVVLALERLQCDTALSTDGGPRVLIEGCGGLPAVTLEDFSVAEAVHMPHGRTRGTLHVPLPMMGPTRRPATAMPPRRPVKAP